MESGQIRMMFLSIIFAATVSTEVTPTNSQENGCCPLKTVGQDLYTLTSHSDLIPYNCKDQCVYHKNDDTRKKYCFAPGNMEVGCNVNKPITEIMEIKNKLDDLKLSLEKHFKEDQTHCSNADKKGIIWNKHKENQENMTMAMLLHQGSYFQNLSESERNAYINESYKNGLSPHSNCPTTKLANCNNDQDAINICAADGINTFHECLERRCPNCACALTSLLGLDCFRMRMVRFIRSNKEGIFGNLLLTPYVDKQNHLTHKPRIYMNYDGDLVPEIDEDTKYWEGKYGETNKAKQMNTAQDIINSANSLKNVFDKTKKVSLGDINNALSKVELDIVGLAPEEKKNIEDAQTLIYKSEVNVTDAHNSLETLSKETVTQVNQMIYYLNFVNDKWPIWKIAKFLSFTAKKLVNLCDTSIAQINDAQALFRNVEGRLAGVRGKITSFQHALVELSDANSGSNKAAIKKLEEELLIPLCGVAGILPLLWWLTCPAGVIAFEATKKKWEDKIKNNKNAINHDMTLVENINTDLVENIKTLEDEGENLKDYGFDFQQVASVDWNFTIANIIGFKAARKPVLKTLHILETEADDYLKKHP